LNRFLRQTHRRERNHETPVAHTCLSDRISDRVVVAARITQCRAKSVFVADTANANAARSGTADQSREETGTQGGAAGETGSKRNEGSAMKTFRPNPRMADGFMIDTAGWTSPHAVVNLGPCICGSITDGISIDLCGGQDRRSPWHPGGVISFADLEAIYLAAKAKREQTRSSQGEAP
jgi:hypothetical protein